MKFMIRTFVLLLLTNGLLVFMHYNEAGNVTASGGSQSSYGQEIEVMNRADGLYVRHHFTQLSNHRLEIVWPEESIDRTCYLPDGDACSRLDENSTAFEAGEAESQSISYVIPKHDANGETMFFKDAFAKLHNAPVSTTLLHITDEMGLEGLWVNGLVELGSKKMELVDYSLFNGYGAVTDLYWQKADQPLLYTDNQITVYGPDSDITETGFEEMANGLMVTEAPHTTVVIGGENGEVNSERFMVAPDLEKTIDRILITHLGSQYQLPTDEPWTTEIIASFLSEQAVGSEIAHNAYHLLSESLAEDEMEQMTTRIRQHNDEAFSADVLREIFGEVTGSGTSFFTKNSQATDTLYPLLLEDIKGLYVTEDNRLEKGILLEEGKRLYPATEILRELGYDISENEQSLYIESATKSYRFPMKEKFYVYNERRFDLMSMPFEQIGDEFYFEEAMMIRIFHVEIENTDERITINPIAVRDE